MDEDQSSVAVVETAVAPFEGEFRLNAFAAVQPPAVWNERVGLAVVFVASHAAWATTYQE